jgi:hypothetical protein
MESDDLLIPKLGNRRTYSYSRLLMQQFVISVWNEAIVKASSFLFQTHPNQYIDLIESYRKDIHKFANLHLDVDVMIEYIFANSVTPFSNVQKAEFTDFAKKLIYN